MYEHTDGGRSMKKMRSVWSILAVALAVIMAADNACAHVYAAEAKGDFAAGYAAAAAEAEADVSGYGPTVAWSTKKKPVIGLIGDLVTGTEQAEATQADEQTSAFAVGDADAMPEFTPPEGGLESFTFTEVPFEDFAAKAGISIDPVSGETVEETDLFEATVIDESWKKYGSYYYNSHFDSPLFYNFISFYYLYNLLQLVFFYPTLLHNSCLHDGI